MSKRIVIVAAVTIGILFFPFGNDVQVNVGVDIKHPPKVQTKATMEQKRANRTMAMNYAQAGWGWDKKQRKCISQLFTKESRFDHLAKNQQGSSAYGIAQMLKETSKDPSIQLLKAYKYIVHRYGTPCKAWKHSQRRNWY